MPVNRPHPLRAAVFTVDGVPRLGRAEEGVVVDGGALEEPWAPTPEGWQRVASAAGERYELDSVALRAPVSPRQIVCVGLNYRRHAEESGFAIPDAPILFAKLPSALAHPGEPVVLPAGSAAVDWEAELALVVGRPLPRRSPPSAIALAIGGYTGCNDLSDRAAQAADGQWMRAKSFDTACPVGPTVVATSPAIDWRTIRVSCRVNGRVVQDATADDLIFGVHDIVAFINEWITLEPGDLICTGTPAGVGYGMTPPRYLQPGDTVAVEVGAAGELANPVVADPAADRRPPAATSDVAAVDV